MPYQVYTGLKPKGLSGIPCFNKTQWKGAGKEKEPVHASCARTWVNIDSGIAIPYTEAIWRDTGYAGA
jgi:hypothetical protein